MVRGVLGVVVGALAWMAAFYAQVFALAIVWPAYREPGRLWQSEFVFTFTTPKQICPMTGKPCTGRSVLKIENNDKHTFTMFTTYEGEKETKSAEIVYTRQK